MFGFGKKNKKKEEVFESEDFSIDNDFASEDELDPELLAQLAALGGGNESVDEVKIDLAFTERDDDLEFTEEDMNDPNLLVSEVNSSMNCQI